MHISVCVSIHAFECALRDLCSIKEHAINISFQHIRRNISIHTSKLLNLLFIVIIYTVI
jgi:hypothetical protein